MTTPQRLILDRPLAVFDIESTGTSPRADRIIEIAVVKLLPILVNQDYARYVLQIVLFLLKLQLTYTPSWKIVIYADITQYVSISPC